VRRKLLPSAIEQVSGSSPLFDSLFHDILQDKRGEKRRAQVIREARRYHDYPNNYSHNVPSLRGKTASELEEVLGEEEALFRGNLLNQSSLLYPPHGHFYLLARR
jgi:hypothetical protein